MCAHVVCKECGEEIRVRKPTGSTRLNNVKAEGIKVEGRKITFQKGGKLSFPKNSSISFGSPPKTVSFTCTICDTTLEYSIDEIIDD